MRDQGVSASPSAHSADSSIALDSCALRIFYPPQPTTSPPPVLVWYHGGGMVLGSIDGDAAFCARLARVAGCAVASVEYALAPEHAFPRGHENAWSGT
jgi:acetyl esterase